MSSFFIASLLLLIWRKMKFNLLIFKLNDQPISININKKKLKYEVVILF